MDFQCRRHNPTTFLRPGLSCVPPPPGNFRFVTPKKSNFKSDVIIIIFLEFCVGGGGGELSVFTIKKRNFQSGVFLGGGTFTFVIKKKNFF